MQATNETPRPTLASVVRASLEAKHQSVAQAADQLGISYDRLKKGLSSNRFNGEDVLVLMPGQTLEELKEKYDFSVTRQYPLLSKRAGRYRRSVESLASETNDSLAVLLRPSFKWLHAAANALDYEGFIHDLYDVKLGAGMTVFLFCHYSALPEEWETGHSKLPTAISRAVERGANIVYILEHELGVRVYPRQSSHEEDEVDAKFEWYLRIMRGQFGMGSTGGFIALLRVPRCSFCTPRQKQTLFVVKSDAGTEYEAVATMRLPRTQSGSNEGPERPIVVPQQAVVAAEMVKYLQQLRHHLRDAPEIFSLQSSTDEVTPGTLSEKLIEILR